MSQLPSIRAGGPDLRASILGSRLVTAKISVSAIAPLRLPGGGLAPPVTVGAESLP